jgi:putative addiction module component (TIGR02574 family)
VTAEAKKIFEEALALPEQERRVLIDALSDTFEHDVADLSPEWKQEIQGRIAELESGEVEAIPWEQVEAEVREVLKAR